MNTALSVLIIDDEEIVHTTLGRHLRHLGHEVAMARDGEEGLLLVRQGTYDLVLLDIRLPGQDGLAILPQLIDAQPDMAVVMISAHGTMDDVILALRAGAVDYLKKPPKLRELDAVLEKAKNVQKMQRRSLHLENTLAGVQQLDFKRYGSSDLIGAGKAMAGVVHEIDLAVRGGADTILILGETGTGKEVVARQIHLRASTVKSPFIAVNCPGLSETLAESELFGHVKGAFTGATQSRPGYFEMAHGGTLFLDEITDLSPAIQTKLLRSLELRSITRVGSTNEVELSVRVVAAANLSLERRVAEGDFRQDLFFRLNLITIALPALRDRREDIAPLAAHFLEVFLRRRGFPAKRMTAEAVAVLEAYDFPGNVRELRNLVERAAIRSLDGAIEPVHFNLRAGVLEPDPVPNVREGGEREELAQVLNACRWNRAEAARELGISYASLRYKIQKYGLATRE